ncbi:MAG: hypothetical protein JRF63_06075, partial [Deltaproteobacteria bacterium]|nr:hypothetical protein [Deltaproteobacteria bacterium]
LCCESLSCQTSWYGDVCMPDITPGPSSCPDEQPIVDTACDDSLLGIMCSYGMFTTCYCTCWGWQCAE